MLPNYVDWLRFSYFSFWCAIGSILGLSELIFTKKLAANLRFVPAIAGVNSILLSLFILRMNIVPSFNWQIAYWMGISAACILWIRPMFLKGKKFSDRDATEATTITEILPGKIGKVLYEGCLWQARCNDRTVEIPSNQIVYVLRREGNTLIVMPENLF